MQISLLSFLMHCVNHPIMIRLFRASSGIAAVCVVAQVALFGWQMYEQWKLTDAGQNIMWHTKPLRDCIFWSVAGSIAWRIKTLCWSASLTFGKWLWSCFFPTRTTKLHKMQTSLSRRGVPCVTYHANGKAELWAVRGKVTTQRRKLIGRDDRQLGGRACMGRARTFDCAAVDLPSRRA